MPRLEDSYPRAISITGLTWICSSCLSLASGILQRRLDVPTEGVSEDTTHFMRTAVSVLRSVTFMLSRHGQHMCSEGFAELERQGQAQENLDNFQQQLEREGDLAALSDVFLSQESDAMLDDFMDNL